MKDALLTGGAGFIGGHLAHRLLCDGWRVRVLDNLDTGLRANLPAGVELHTGDVRDIEACRRACLGVDSVFHLAAMASVARSVSDPRESHDVTLGGTVNMLIAARDSSVRRFVLSSSASVYGNVESVPTGEDQALSPQSPYAVAKACGEAYCRNFWTLFRLETVVLRYFNVFGPRQSALSDYAAVVPRFLEATANRQTPVIYGDGLQTRDFVYVDDVVAANVRAAKADAVGGQTFNIASGRGSTLCEMLAILERIWGRRICARFEPARPGEVRHSCADISRAREHLNFNPTLSLEDGLWRIVRATNLSAQEICSVR